MVKMGHLVAMNSLCWLDILGQDGLDGMWPLTQFRSADWLESQILCLWAALSVAHWSSMCYLVTWLPFVISKDLQLLTLASWNLTVFLVMSLDIITAIAWLEDDALRSLAFYHVSLGHYLLKLKFSTWYQHLLTVSLSEEQGILLLLFSFTLEFHSPCPD